MTFKSIHVPASLVQRIVKVLHWLALLALPAITTLLLTTWTWIAGRVDADYVASKVALVSSSAQTAQADSHHAKVLADAHEREVIALWRAIVVLETELWVQRTYASARDKGAIIQQARNVFGNRYDLDRLNRATDPPHESAARVILGLDDWRPKR